MGTNGSYNSSTGVLTVSNSSTTATLAGGSYCFSAITLSGGGIMSVASAVNLYVTGATHLSGGSVANTTSNASNLKLFSSYNGSSDNNGVTLSGGSGAYMSVYAPNTGVTFSGSSNFYGSVVANNIVNSGGTKIHYDGSVAVVLAPNPALSKWHEVRN